MSDPDVVEAALKIQGAMKGMLHRQQMSLPDDGDSTDRIATLDEEDLPDTSDSAEAASVRSGQEQPTEEDQEQRVSTVHEDTEGQEAAEEEVQ